MDEALADFLSRHGLAANSLVPLAGDASSRRYYRASTKDASRSLVIMADSPFPAATESGEPFAFARWRDFLDALGIRVPALLAMDRSEGLALLEDLGDELLQHRVEALGPEACRGHYLLAVAWGCRLAEEGSKRFDPAHEPWDDPLDSERLGVEMDFFLQHELGRDHPPGSESTGAMATARELLHALCRELHAVGAGEDGMVLCHRDYHARNLLVLPDGDAAPPRLAMIDFQDIRRGPRAYDLASLIHDPYVSLPTALREELAEAWRPSAVGSRDWSQELRLAAGQRLIKAAGSYAYLGKTLGRKEYLQWFAPALTRAFEQLADWPQARQLEQSLSALGIDW